MDKNYTPLKVVLHDDEPSCQGQRCTDEAARTWEDCNKTPALTYVWKDKITTQPLRLRLCGKCADVVASVRC